MKTKTFFSRGCYSLFLRINLCFTLIGWARKKYLSSELLMAGEPQQHVVGTGEIRSPFYGHSQSTSRAEGGSTNISAGAQLKKNLDKERALMRQTKEELRKTDTLPSDNKSGFEFPPLFGRHISNSLLFRCAVASL